MTPTRAPYARSSRCVHCARLESDHKNGECQWTHAGAPSTRFDTLNLPKGKTCGDCVHIPRCMAIFGHIPADETCDWFPVRYLDRQQLIKNLKASKP